MPLWVIQRHELATSSCRGSEPDIELRRLNVAEVPGAAIRSSGAASVAQRSRSKNPLPGYQAAISAHIRTDKPRRSAALLDQVHRLLRDRFGFYFSTIQIETNCLDEDHARELDISALLRLPQRG